jgi:hypothetical protein
MRFVRGKIRRSISPTLSIGAVKLGVKNILGCLGVTPNFWLRGSRCGDQLVGLWFTSLGHVLWFPSQYGKTFAKYQAWNRHIFCKSAG